jgi:tetratricopeptide (TPR) repeat protein
LRPDARRRLRSGDRECLPDRYDARVSLAELFTTARLREDAGAHGSAAGSTLQGARRLDRLEPAARKGPADALAYAGARSGRRGAARARRSSPPRWRRAAGSTPAAIDCRALSLKEDPDQLFLYNFVATLRNERGDTAEAIKLWKGLIENHAQDLYVIENRALFHRSLGEAYERLGLNDPAADQYRQALEASPADNAARKGLARTSGQR